MCLHSLLQPTALPLDPRLLSGSSDLPPVARRMLGRLPASRPTPRPSLPYSTPLCISSSGHGCHCPGQQGWLGGSGPHTVRTRAALRALQTVPAAPGSKETQCLRNKLPKVRNVSSTAEDADSRTGMQALHSHDCQPIGHLIRKAHSTIHEGSTMLGRHTRG